MHGLKCRSSSFLGVFHSSRLMNFRDIYANPHAVASRRQGFGNLPRLNLMSLAPPPRPCAVARPGHRAVEFHTSSRSLGPSPRGLRDAILSLLRAAPCCSQGKVPQNHQFTPCVWWSVVSNLFSSRLVKNSAGITFS